MQASSLLLKATKIIAKSDMNDIVALGDLKAYLSGQETVISDDIAFMWLTWSFRR
jgi:hypothetical protein